MRDFGRDDELELGERGLLPLFARNRAWVDAKITQDPDLFYRLRSQQNPRYFWIGCSDSRVPATQIVDLDPGEMFVHRNVANLAIADDPNFAATLQFAVEVLHVEHIIVVGHYGCGGIKAAMEPETDDWVGRWLRPIRQTDATISGVVRGGQAHADLLCERNVAAQIDLLCDNPIIRQEWGAGGNLTLHGWVYAVGDGLLRVVREPISSPPA